MGRAHADAVSSHAHWPLSPQAMGIYLYGELMLSEDARQQQLARRCFELTKGQMDVCSAQVVAEMLF